MQNLKIFPKTLEGKYKLSKDIEKVSSFISYTVIPIGISFLTYAESENILLSFQAGGIYLLLKTLYRFKRKVLNRKTMLERYQQKLLKKLNDKENLVKKR